jgi:tight adherence protein C
MKTMLSSMKVLQDSQVKAAQRKLLQAGIRSKEWAVAVIFGRMVLPIVFGGMAVFWVYGTDGFADWSPLKKYGLVAVTFILSYKAPDIFLTNKIKKRTDLIRKGLPDALDLLVICAEAGLTVDAAFHRVARELGRAYPELGEEFTLTAIELGFLTDRRQAFENLAMRVDLDAVKGVTTTMVQTEKYGTPLASALRVLSAEFRNERMMRAEEKAARLPAIMTVPLILFILPVLFVVILGPAACSIKDALMTG